MTEESAAMNTPEETIKGVTNNEHRRPTWLVEKIEHAERIALNRPSRQTIYRVPDSLRELNKEVYTPQVISIGPFHSQKLRSMENYKLSYFRSFMERITKINEEKLASIIQDSEERVRGCYAEAIPIDSDTLRQIILVDASFIIELFLRSAWSVEVLREGDFIEADPWLLSRMKLDLSLLENQLPFFIINKLYELLPLDPSPSTLYPSSFLELTFNFFEYQNVQNIRHDEIDSEEIMHFVDLLRYLYLPHHQITRPTRSLEVVNEMYCASQLAEAGLKFKPSSSRSIHLKFNEGVLEIPRFTLHNIHTEIYARNLIAFEQCHYPLETYVTDYFMMLDFLINTGKDVDILIQEGILENTMGTNSRPPNLLGNLCTGISLKNLSDDYYDLCKQLVDFRRKHWYVILVSRLREDFCRTPWMGPASAIILLILTLIQTVFTVISTFK